MTSTASVIHAAAYKDGEKDNEDVEAIVAAEIHDALGYEASILSDDREELFKYYMGEPYGNEIDGQSQVITTDVADTIDWILPQCIKTFTAAPEPIKFISSSRGGADQAREATKTVDHIFFVQNKGFTNLYTWFKDALIQKNGFLKIWYEESEELERDYYEGVAEDNLSQFVEKVEELAGAAATAVPGLPSPHYDLELRKYKRNGRVHIQPFPPEEFMIDRDAREIEESRFCCHRQRRTVSELVQEGVFDREEAMSLTSDEENWTTEAQTRSQHDEEQGTFSAVNEEMQEVWIYECYLRIDMDGDGVAERYKVIAAGPNYQVVSIEAWDDPVPFCSVTPVIQPHRFFGRSIAELVADIQVIKSTILRQYLDGLYLSNHPRHEVVENWIEDMDDLIDAGPGAIVRVRQPGAVNPIQTLFAGGEALQGMEYMERIRESRTGVSAQGVGITKDTVSDSMTAERMVQSMSQGKVDLIVRVFAETGLKPAYRMILGLIVKYSKGPMQIADGDTYLDVDPTIWDPEMDITTNVGLGAVDKQQEQGSAMALLGIQRQAHELGMVGPEEAMNALALVVASMGYGDHSQFFKLPDPNAAQQQGPSELDIKKMEAEIDAQAQIQIEQIKAEGKQAELAQKDQFQRYSEDRKHERELIKMQQEAELKRDLAVMELESAERVKNREIDMTGATRDMQIGGQIG